MTKTQQRLVDLADALSPEAQQALLDIAESLARQPRRFYDGMTEVQRAELAASIAEADRGDVAGQDQLDHELDSLFAGKA